MRALNWPLALDAVIEQWRHVPLAHGKTDCLQFCAAAVEAVTGENHLDRFPTYRSRREAVLILRASGGMRPLITSVLGNPKHPAMAKRGDVVIGLNADGEEAAGICIGSHWTGPTLEGLKFYPLSSAALAWSVL